MQHSFVVSLLLIALGIRSTHATILPILPLPGVLNVCTEFYILKKGDTCSAVEKKFGLSHLDFVKWNPILSIGCSINLYLNFVACVGTSKGPKTTLTAPITTTRTTSTSMSTSSSTSTKTLSSTTSSKTSSITTSTTNSKTSSTLTKTSTSSSTITTTSSNETYSIRVPLSTWNVTATSIETTFPPQRTQAGQPGNCMNWYLVSPGDTCASIVASQNWIDLAGFLAANPAVGADCSGLYVGWWVCVNTQPLSSTVSFVYTTDAGNVTASVPDPTPWTPTTYPTANSSFAAAPTASGLASDCKAFYKAGANQTCQDVPDIAARLISQQQFFGWNPALNGACNSVTADYYYCVHAGSTLPAGPTSTQAPSTVPSGLASNCKNYYSATGYESCDDIVALYGTFSSSDLRTWNPSIGSDCLLQANVVYCVGIPGTPTSRTSEAVAASTPTSTGTSSGSSTTSITTS